jgi:hypothetical protein
MTDVKRAAYTVDAVLFDEIRVEGGIHVAGRVWPGEAEVVTHGSTHQMIAGACTDGRPSSAAGMLVEGEIFGALGTRAPLKRELRAGCKKILA